MLVKVASSISLFVVVMFACTADCTSCHPKLDIKNDAKHKPLADCMTCHPPQSLKDTPMSGCGTDCFSCHSVSKLTAMPQHKVIDDCIVCHKSMDKNPFLKNEKSFLNEKEIKIF